MAENPISKDDIIDGAGVSDSIKKIIDLLNGELSDALKNVTKVAGEYNHTPSTVFSHILITHNI